MITEIIARQREEIKEKLKSKYVVRDISKKFDQYLNKNIIKVITGVRRSGKSTFSIHFLKDKKYAYVNFDEHDLVSVSLDDLLSSIKEVYGDVRILFLDEIQNLKDWELLVNGLHRLGYNLIITGSNSKLLSKELSTHLTGRYIEFEIFPFSFREFLRWKKFSFENLNYLKEKQGLAKNYLREYLNKGGFPEYLVESLSKDYLLTLFRAIIYSDVIKRWNIKYAVSVESLARYLLSIYSRQYTANNLRKLLGFRSVFTVLNYIKYLKESYLIFDLERFSFKEKEFIKTPRKVYSIDLGLSNQLTITSEENLGLKMENLVFLELRKQNLQPYYYVTEQNNEVDFVIKEGLKIRELIQVTKASSKEEVKPREIKALLKASKELKCKNLLVITWDYESEEDGIKFIPLWKWLLNKVNKQ